MKNDKGLELLNIAGIDSLHLAGGRQNIRIALMNEGLGNQAFQYIFSRWIEITTGEPCYVDDTPFFAPDRSHNGYELDKIFGVKPRLLSQHIYPQKFEEILWYASKGVPMSQQLFNMGYPLSLIAETSDFSFNGNVSWTPCNEYNPSLRLVSGCIYFHGYWINVNWFKDIMDVILKELTFPELPDEKNAKLADEIENSNSIAIHFRTKGTFADEWKMPEEAFASAVKAMEEAREKSGGEEFIYYVFSDGFDYVKEHLGEVGLADKKIVFVEGNVEPNNYIDMQLMTLCKHRIVNNSSFCYLAALLRKKRDGLIVNLNSRRGIV